MAARMLVLGALNWAAEWWNPRRGSLDTVVRTAQSLVRHGLACGKPQVMPGRPALQVLRCASPGRNSGQLPDGFEPA